MRDVAQASHSPPRKARHASVAPADESATLERLGAAAPTEVLVALLGDVKQDLDRVRAAPPPARDEQQDDNQCSSTRGMQGILCYAYGNKQIRAGPNGGRSLPHQSSNQDKD